MAKTLRQSVVGIVSAALIVQGIGLAGCMTTQEQRIGANDGTDACYVHRVALDNTRSFFEEDVLKGALAGLAVGVVAGALAGGTRGAAIGAVSGLIVGAAAGGFFNELVRQQGVDGALTTTLTTVERENQNLLKTQTAMDNLRNCRRQEIRAVQADFRAKRITREVGEQRMALIRTRMQQDYEIALAINGRVQERGGEFDTALKEVKATGKGKTQTAIAKQTASNVALNQGVQKRTDQMLADASEASLEQISQMPWSTDRFLFG